jgi:hypothetical protein
VAPRGEEAEAEEEEEARQLLQIGCTQVVRRLYAGKRIHSREFDEEEEEDLFEGGGGGGCSTANQVRLGSKHVKHGCT